MSDDVKKLPDANGDVMSASIFQKWMEKVKADTAKKFGVQKSILEHTHEPPPLLPSFGTKIAKLLCGVQPMTGPTALMHISYDKALPSENLLDNGGFTVWQRGTTFVDIETPAFTADRWRVSALGFWGATVSRCDDARHGDVCMEIVTPDLVCVSQRLDNLKELRGKWVTFSVGVHADKLCDFSLRLSSVSDAGVDEATYDDYIFTSETWYRFTITCQLPDEELHGVTASVVAHPRDGQTRIRVDGARMVLGHYPHGVDYSPSSGAEDLKSCQKYYQTGGFGGPIVSPPIGGISTEPPTCPDYKPKNLLANPGFEVWQKGVACDKVYTCENVVPKTVPGHVFVHLTLPPEFAGYMWRVHRDTTELCLGVDYKIDGDRRIIFAEVLKAGMTIRVTTMGKKPKKKSQYLSPGVYWKEIDYTHIIPTGADAMSMGVWAEPGPTPPENPVFGTMWYNTLKAESNVFNGDAWLPLGASGVVHGTPYRLQVHDILHGDGLDLSAATMTLASDHISLAADVDPEGAMLLQEWFSSMYDPADGMILNDAEKYKKTAELSIRDKAGQTATTVLEGVWPISIKTDFDGNLHGRITVDVELAFDTAHIGVTETVQKAAKELLVRGINAKGLATLKKFGATLGSEGCDSGSAA